MADQIFQADFDDSQIIKKLDDLEKQVLSIGKSVDTVGDTAAASLNQAADAAGNFTAEMDTAATQTARQAKAVEGARAANQTWLQSIRQTIAGQQIGGKTLGEWGEQAQNFANRINLGAKATSGMSGAWRVFNGILKASGIGLIVTAVAALVNYFTKFQPLLDKISQLTAGFSAALNVVAERIILVGSAIGKLFSGDFSGAWETAGQAVSGFGEELVNATIDAYNLQKAIQELRDDTLSFSVEQARVNAQIAQLRRISDDATRSINERSKAAQQASALEISNAEKAYELALRARENARKGFEEYSSDQTKKEEFAAAEKALFEAADVANEARFNAEKEQREFRKEAAAERQKQMEEERKRAEQLRKEYEKLFADIQRQAESLEIENIFNPVDRVIAQFDAAKADINRIRERLLEIAPDAAARARVEEEVAKLFDQLIIKYREELFAAQQEVEALKKGTEPIQPLPIADTIDDDLRFRAQGIIRQLQTAAQEAIAGQQPRSLAEILGLSQEGLEGLKDAANQVIDSLGEIADARVKEADAAVDAAERRVNAAQEALIREQDLAEQGLANNTDLAKQQLDTAKKLQEEAEKERAKAVRSQILLDSVGQISSLITASANIFKALSVIPFAGIPLAIGTIAVMFGAFAKAKSDALKAAAIPKFRKGGKLEGPAHEFGGIAVSDREGNVYGEAEGGEWIVNRQGSREHDRFLNRLNKGEFAGVDLNQYIPTQGGSAVLSDSARRIERVDRERREIEVGQNYAAIVAAHERAANGIIQAIKEQPEIYPLTNYKVRRRKGRNTYTEIVREEK